LTQICKTRKEYLSRLFSREINSNSNNIEELTNCLKEQLRKKQELNIDLAIDTYEKLKEYEIHDEMIQQTVYDGDFSTRLMGDCMLQTRIHGRNYLATRRFFDFIKNNKDNWLFDNNQYKIIKKLCAEKKIKFLWESLQNINYSIGTFSIMYISNIQEHKGSRSLDFYRKFLSQISEFKYTLIWTSTNCFGEGNVEIYPNIYIK